MQPTYNKIEFTELLNSIMNKSKIGSIKIDFLLLLNQDAKKWYDKEYTSDFSEITENTIYGIKYDGMIMFDFKTGKIDNLLKSFLIKFTSRFTEYRLVDGFYKTVSIKDEIMAKIIEHNQDRVDKGLFYTTLYGIGFWAILSSKKDHVIAENLHTYLKSKNIDYSNEYSDAGWVYRFKINKSIELHNELLTKFKVH